MDHLHDMRHSMDVFRRSGQIQHRSFADLLILYPVYTPTMEEINFSILIGCSPKLLNPMLLSECWFPNTMDTNFMFFDPEGPQCSVCTTRNKIDCSFIFNKWTKKWTCENCNKLPSLEEKKHKGWEEIMELLLVHLGRQIDDFDCQSMMTTERGQKELTVHWASFDMLFIEASTPREFLDQENLLSRYKKAKRKMKKGNMKSWAVLSTHNFVNDHVQYPGELEQKKEISVRAGGVR